MIHGTALFAGYCGRAAQHDHPRTAARAAGSPLRSALGDQSTTVSGEGAADIAAMSSTNAVLELDKNGVPMFSGEPHLLEEYIDRAWDMYFGLMGEPSKQATAPIKLRQGCRGVVYNAVKHLTQRELVTAEYDGSSI